ncbi:MAG: hypothetical protein E6J63_00285 [Deltaproteobacteria bacterium]|nr:MAG: hypothetical protein E6J63_00285 [Deltaproteobacteria bacterium]
MTSFAAVLIAAAAQQYVVTAGEGARELSIEARIPAFPDRDGELSVSEGAEPFVSDVVIVSADGPVPLERRGDSWFAPQCAAHGCRIRYGFALRRAAEGRDDEDLAALYGDMIVSPPGAWLLRPLRVTQDSTAELKVSAAEGVRFAAGLPPGVLSASSLGGLPYAAFGDLRVEPIRLQGVSLTVAIARARRRQSEEELLDWIRASAAMIADYFGRFPADGALLLVAPAPDKQIHGRARGTGGASILFSLGTELEIAQARGSWELVHELVHLGFPSVPRRHHWAEEGLATYVEPIARARAGDLSAEKVWGDLLRGLPQGLPRKGDEGLDRTHTWGRTYWGGALFWLLGDIQIRERTGNRFGLEHALRALVANGGNIADRWPLRRALEVGDRATGTKVLEELYAKMASAPVDVDLDALFHRLGVEEQGRSVKFDDRAPLAPIRRAITERR